MTLQNIYAIVEVMGHRKYAGKISQVEGMPGLMRIDMPGIADPVFVGSSAIFQITPCPEAYAVEHAAKFVEASAWQGAPHLNVLLPKPAAPELPKPVTVDAIEDYSDDFDDDDIDEDDEVEEPDHIEDDHAASIRWAKRLVEKGNFVVLDTETTGLQTGYDVPVQIAIVDSEGNVLVDTLVNPGVVPVSEGAARVHGLTSSKLADAPSWAEVAPKVAAAIAGKHLVIYNASYDCAMIRQADRLAGWVMTIPPMQLISCAMQEYAAFFGDWNDYRQSYRWQKLTDACAELKVEVEAPAHSALGDALRTLGVIKAMAAAPLPVAKIPL